MFDHSWNRCCISTATFLLEAVRSHRGKWKFHSATNCNDFNFYLDFEAMVTWYLLRTCFGLISWHLLVMTCLSLARRRIDRSNRFGRRSCSKSVRLSQKQLLEPLGFPVKHQFTHAAGHWGSKKWPTGPRASVIENTISDWLLARHCRCEVFHQSLTDSHLLSAMSVKALLGVRLGKWCYAVYMYIPSFSESNWYNLWKSIAGQLQCEMQAVYSGGPKSFMSKTKTCSSL